MNGILILIIFKYVLSFIFKKIKNLGFYFKFYIRT